MIGHAASTICSYMTRLPAFEAHSTAFAAAARGTRLISFSIEKCFSLYPSISLFVTVSKVAFFSSTVLKAATVAPYSSHSLIEASKVETQTNSSFFCSAFSSFANTSSRSPMWCLRVWPVLNLLDSTSNNNLVCCLLFYRHISLWVFATFKWDPLNVFVLLSGVYHPMPAPSELQLFSFSYRILPVQHRRNWSDFRTIENAHTVPNFEHYLHSQAPEMKALLGPVIELGNFFFFGFSHVEDLIAVLPLYK